VLIDIELSTKAIFLSFDVLSISIQYKKIALKIGKKLKIVQPLSKPKLFLKYSPKIDPEDNPNVSIMILI
jgi:hypothetical protein